MKPTDPAFKKWLREIEEDGISCEKSKATSEYNESSYDVINDADKHHLSWCLSRAGFPMYIKARGRPTHTDEAVKYFHSCIIRRYRDGSREKVPVLSTYKTPMKGDAIFKCRRTKDDD